MALGQFFFQHFGFLCQFSFHQLLHILYTSYHRRYVVSMLTASLNKKEKKIFRATIGSMRFPDQM
jgi:hypothetical protein